MFRKISYFLKDKKFYLIGNICIWIGILFCFLASSTYDKKIWFILVPILLFTIVGSYMIGAYSGFVEGKIDALKELNFKNEKNRENI